MRCWWALTKPGVTTAPGAAEGGHAGVRAGRLGPVDHGEDRPVRHEDGRVDQDRPRLVHREHVVAGHDEVRDRVEAGVERQVADRSADTRGLEWSDGQTTARTANHRACPGPSCSATTRPCSGTGTPSPAAPIWRRGRSASRCSAATTWSGGHGRRRRRRRARPLPAPRGAAVARARSRTAAWCARTTAGRFGRRRPLRPRAVGRRRRAACRPGPPRRPSTAAERYGLVWLCLGEPAAGIPEIG